MGQFFKMTSTGPAEIVSPSMPLTRRDRLNGRLLSLICQLAVKTCRFSLAHWAFVGGREKNGEAVLFGTWHGQTMMLIAFMRHFRPDAPVAAMIPDDWRGAALYEFLNRMGIIPNYCGWSDPDGFTALFHRMGLMDPALSSNRASLFWPRNPDCRSCPSPPTAGRGFQSVAGTPTTFPSRSAAST